MVGADGRNVSYEQQPDRSAVQLRLLLVRRRSTDQRERVDYGLHDDPAVESASSELGSIAGAIESLQNRLAQAQDQLNNVAAVQTTEFEIGRLFVEAQRFSEASLSKLEIQIQEILIEAEAKQPKSFVRPRRKLRKSDDRRASLRRSRTAPPRRYKPRSSDSPM